MQTEKGSLAADVKALQNEKYEMIFRVFRDYCKVITSVTFWGVADNRTCLDHYPVPGRKNYPLLFDTKLKPKEAFYKVVNF